MKPQIVFGTSVLNNYPPKVKDVLVNYPGQNMLGNNGFQMDEDLMSRHILLLGGSGCGKTNVFLYTIDILRKSMTENDVAIVFDTKGEFYDSFSKTGDYLIGNSIKFRKKSYTWNIFDEILADGWEEENISMNAREIAAALFHDRISESQPFFGNAAKDIFRGILLHFIRQAKKNAEWIKRLNNYNLIEAFQNFKIEDYKRIFEHYKDLRGLLSYFGDGKSNQALGVFGELNSMLSEYFVGIFAQDKSAQSISMRNVVRGKNSKILFVEYDLAVGETLTPMYRLLIDQTLKEALSRNSNVGRVFLFVDEFKLLPHLEHIDDALNFGRGLGVRVMAGIQSIDQLYDIYGKEKGAVIAGGFGSIFAFHTNDSSSREYIRKRFGSNIMIYEYNNILKNKGEVDKREGNTVEEWDQMKLGVGQAIIGLGYNSPFLFQFDEYGR